MSLINHVKSLLTVYYLTNYQDILHLTNIETGKLEMTCNFVFISSLVPGFLPLFEQDVEIAETRFVKEAF